MRLQGELPGMSQGECKHGTSQTVTFLRKAARMPRRQDSGSGKTWAWPDEFHWACPGRCPQWLKKLPDDAARGELRGVRK